MKPRDALSVMQSRHEAIDSLDLFPTPPWGTRALIEFVLPYCGYAPNSSVWEPAAGMGHMAEPLKDYFREVYASDVHDYGCGYDVGSFIGADVFVCPFKPDWIITNPPFNLGEEFVRRALTEATVGVAMLARTAFIESAARYPLFASQSFAALAPFSARVPMVKGRWDPAASSATSYAWFVWRCPRAHGGPMVIMIPPDAKERCSRQDDIARFATPSG